MNYSVNTDKYGDVWVTVESRHYVFGKFAADEKVLSDVEQIVNRYEMYKYKKKYKSFFEVLDGTMWGMGASYADGTNISSSGHQSFPANYTEALEACGDYFAHWLKIAEANADNGEQLMRLRYEEYSRSKSTREIYEAAIAEGKTEFTITRHDAPVVPFSSDDKAMHKLKRLIDTFNMYEYSGNYKLEGEASNGIEWNFSAVFSSGKRIAARGYGASPKGSDKAFRNLKGIFEAEELGRRFRDIE